MTDMFAAAYPP